MTQEIRRRLTNRTLNENSYFLISSQQKQQSIDRIRSTVAGLLVDN